MRRSFISIATVLLTAAAIVALVLSAASEFIGPAI